MQEVGQAPVDVVDVEGGDLHARQAERVLRWAAKILLPAEDGAPVEVGRARQLAGDKGLERRTAGGALEPPCLIVEPLERLHLLVAPELGALHRRL